MYWLQTFSPVAIQLCQQRGLKNALVYADYAAQFQTWYVQYDPYDGTQFWTRWQLQKSSVVVEAISQQ